MITALIDVPRCLNVDACYVGSPRSVDRSGGVRLSAWNEAVHWGGTQAYREQAVKECLDTIAVLRGYREPLENETWLVPAASERRLLAQVNAIIALGPEALKQVIELSIDADVPDPGRVFAGLLVLGCVEGHDWLESVHQLFVSAALRSPTEMGAAVEALSLGPNPELATVLERLRDDERPRVRSSAIRVLAFRGALSESYWTKAMGDPDTSVLSAALSAPLREYDRVSCERTLRPLYRQRGSEWLVRLALRAGLSLRLGTAHDCAVEITQSDPSWADAVQAMAMFGYLADAPHIRPALRGPHLQDCVDAAARLGSIELVPDLLDLLDHSDLMPEAGTLAKQALTTITGLAFVATSDLPEALDLWSLHSSRFDRGIRYRQGRPLTLDALLQSLLTGPGARNVRQGIYLEMLAATESRVPRFSAYDFVGIQNQSLRRIEHWLGGSQVQR